MAEMMAAQVLMTQVIGNSGAGERLLGEIESSGISVGWNRATLTEPARAALHEILERSGGVADRWFELRHGSLVLLKCQMLGQRAQISFDGSRRQRAR